MDFFNFKFMCNTSLFDFRKWTNYENICLLSLVAWWTYDDFARKQTGLIIMNHPQHLWWQFRCRRDHNSTTCTFQPKNTDKPKKVQLYNIKLCKNTLKMAVFFQIVNYMELEFRSQYYKFMNLATRLFNIVHDKLMQGNHSRGCTLD